MSDQDKPSNLPATILEVIEGIPAALVPASVKALDRLIGAAADIPVAWLEYQKAKIVSKTEAFKTIDQAIIKSAAVKAEAHEQFSDRALDSLVRKSYRQQNNKEAISVAMLEELREIPVSEVPPIAETVNDSVGTIDDDWLNVFERFAEDASTERMQKLWGRVLAGEVRSPGKYGMRTLRFLSEFSQNDAIKFSDLCKNAFAGQVPKALANASGDISSLLEMEAAGLIQGGSGPGLELTLTFDSTGRVYLVEQDLAVGFVGQPLSKMSCEVIQLTPLARELISLLPERDARNAARLVGEAFRQPVAKSGFIATVNSEKFATPLEILWQEQTVVTMPGVANPFSQPSL